MITAGLRHSVLNFELHDSRTYMVKSSSDSAITKFMILHLFFDRMMKFVILTYQTQIAVLIQL